jgi:hypothetical protein
VPRRDCEPIATVLAAKVAIGCAPRKYDLSAAALCCWYLGSSANSSVPDNPYRMTTRLDGSSVRTLKERLRFETFLSDLAARLLNIEPEELYPAIRSSIEELADILGDERGGIAQFSGDGGSLFLCTPSRSPRGRRRAPCGPRRPPM